MDGEAARRDSFKLFVSQTLTHWALYSLDSIADFDSLGSIPVCCGTILLLRSQIISFFSPNHHSLIPPRGTLSARKSTILTLRLHHATGHIWPFLTIFYPFLPLLGTFYPLFFLLYRIFSPFFAFFGPF